MQSLKMIQNLRPVIQELTSRIEAQNLQKERAKR
jgi:hypothetical protein